MSLTIYIILVAALLLAVLGIAYTRYKLRIVWKEMEDVKRQFHKTDEKLLHLSKEYTLAKFDDLKLPSLMPSQHGEDVVLGRYFNFKRHGFFVEIGAFDGVDLSNTYFFEALGWDGLLIEPNPSLCAEYATKRPNSRFINAAILDTGETQTTLSLVEGEPALSFSETSKNHRERVEHLNTNIIDTTVPVTTLTEAFSGIDQPIDFISIDVEGAEINVLRTLDFERHAPEIFIIEDNSNGQDTTVADFLKPHSYEKRFRLGCNDFYLKACNKSKLSLY